MTLPQGKGFSKRGPRVWKRLLGTGVVAASAALWIMALPALAQLPATVQEANRLVEQGLVEQAIPTLEAAAKQYPDSAEVQVSLANAYMRAGGYTRTTRAHEIYGRVLQLDPNNKQALLSLGIMGSYRFAWRQQGIESLSKLLELEPTNNQARAQRALLYGYLGDLGRSVADYDIVIPTNPPLPVVLDAAQVYTYAGDYEKARPLFERYLAAGNTVKEYPAIAYGTVLRETGSIPESIEVLEQETQPSEMLDGVTIRARAALALSYTAAEEYVNARNVLRPLEGRFDSRMILARSFHQMDGMSSEPVFTKDVIRLCRQVLNRPPDNVYLTYVVAREAADILSGFPTEQRLARRTYRRLLQQQPNDKLLQVQLAVLEREMGEIPKAELVQRLQTALTPFPADSFQKRVFAQAVARLDTPDPELLPFYQQFLQAGVEEPLLHYRIAQIQVQRGDFAAARQAIAAYEQTGIGQEDIGGRLLLLADIDRREGKTEESFQRYEQLLNEPSASRSDRTAALQGMTRIRRIQGRLPEIVALYDRVIESDPQDTAKPLGQASVAYQADLISEEEAEAILNEWLANRSEFDNPVELFSLVSALPANSQREALYRRLVVVDPSYMPVQLRLLQVLAEQNPEEAEQKAAELIARDPDNIGAYFVQGQLAETLGNLDQASQAYEQVVQRSMNDTDALAALGGVRFQQAQYRSAIQLYNQVLELEPENRVAQIALAELSTTEGRRLEAIEDLEELQRQQETDGQTDADLDRRIQRIREGFLQQRGFQPPWERY